MKEIEFEIVRMILKLGNQLNNMRDIDLEQKNLTTVQSETMLFFGANEGATVTNLKDHLRISHQAARNIVERLKNKKYLYTAASEEDRRSNAVFLTEEGKKLFFSLRGTGNVVGNTLLAGFSAQEKALLLRLIDKASGNMR